MPVESNQGPGPEEPTRSTLAAYLFSLGPGSAHELESLCCRYPDLERELASLAEAWFHEVEARLGSGRASFGERLRAELGADVDPGISLQGPAPESTCDSGPSSELLARLRAHAPASSRYRILGEIGHGGMGAVLRVWDEDLRRTSAMKVVLGRAERTGDTPAVDARTLGRFLEEAQVTGQLDHPGIVPVHELGLGSDGRVYFTMRLVKGEDLRKIYQHVRTGHDGWNPTRALSVLLKVCEAMAYAHDKKVIHRDLKPANVMVGRYGEVYVMDWGLARVLGEQDRHDLRLRTLAASSQSMVATDRRAERDETPDSPLVTMDGAVIGTPAYMPPEQARGEIEALGPHSDVYALGAMLYELLTGQMPYVPAGTRVPPRVILARLIEEPPKALVSLAPRAPAELVAICEKAMARAPEARYRDMKALADDLRAYLERRVVKAYESGTWAETKKWVQRNKPFAAALAGIVLVAGGGAAAFARKADEATRTADEATRLKDEAVARDRESRLRGLIQELEYFDTLDDDVYTYARQQTRPAHEWWLERAHELVDGVPDGDPQSRPWRPGLADVLAAQEKLRRNALPYTDEERAGDRASHPRAAELETKRARATWMARMLGDEPWPSESEAEAELAGEELPIDPAAPPFGSELRALLLARRAVAAAEAEMGAADGTAEPAEDDHKRSHLWALDTLAWAAFRAGRLNESLALHERTLGTAIEEELDTVADPADPERREFRLAHELRAWRGTEARQARRAELRALREEIVSLERAVEERPTWTYSSSEDTWWEQQLVGLVAGLKQLRRNVEFAEASVRGAEAEARWRDAIAAIAGSETYRGVKWPSGERLTPQLGLLPIGPDPASGLWEFAHLATGTPAERGPDGRIVLEPSMGLVLVLLPGGRVPVAANYEDDQDGRLTRIDLDPFLLSKYEMTQEQWRRIGGWEDPRRESRATRLRHRIATLLPAFDLNWHEGQGLLASMGWLRLPSEAQWEYGCRATTTSTWWPGDDEEKLRGVANISFEIGADNRPQPIGARLANSFGLHDVHGNASEWCQDALFGGPLRDGDGLKAEPAGANDRSIRGGSYYDYAALATSSNSNVRSSGDRDWGVGLRPARGITR